MGKRAPGKDGAGSVGPGQAGKSSRKARPQDKRRGSPPDASGEPRTAPKGPGPAAPLSTNPGENPERKKIVSAGRGTAPSAAQGEDVEASGQVRASTRTPADRNPSGGPPPKPKKSPHQKRAEKRAEREQWTDEDIDEAYRANGGIPKPRPSPESRVNVQNDVNPGDNAPPGGNPPRGRGRPTKYPDMDLERIESLARGGLTKREIAWASGICYETLRTYQRDFSAFSAAILRGRRLKAEDAERSMHLMANGFAIPEEKVQYDMQVGEWKRTTVLKVIPPDVKAQHILLQKAETGSWAPSMKHTGKVDHAHKGTIHHQIDTAELKDLLNGADSTPGA